MVRIVDYESRKRAVLASAINRYIEDAEAVASDTVTEEFDLSSATIRNIFAELEKEGYLTHAHTSGGKIPSKKGYRYYVDFLVSQMGLLAEEKERIIGEYKKEIKRLDNLLEKTSEVISVITHYTGITSFLEWHDRFFYKGIDLILEQPEFRNLDKMRLLIKMVEEKKRLLDVINRDYSGKVKIYIGEELGCVGMDNCSLVVSSYCVKSKPVGRLAVLGPMRMEYKRIIPALEYISEVLSEELDRI